MSELTAVSLFAGIEGIGLALKHAGVKVKASVEIDGACRGVIARHFPETTLFNDVTEVTGDQLRAAGFVPRRGILTGGFPCQDLSIAGRRKGLAGARSGLFWHIMRLADDLRPQWLLLENVPGLLSAVCSCPGDDTCVYNRRAVECGEWRGDPDNREWFANVPHIAPGGACAGGCMPAHGGAMGTVVGALGKRGYGFAARVLDAQWFGVPQRRERVFIVGCLGDRAAPVEILLEPEGGTGRAAPGARPGTRVAGTLAASAGSGGLGGIGQSANTITGRLVETASTLQGGGKRGYRVDAEGAAGGHLVAIPVAFRGRENGSQAECGADGDPAFARRTPGGGSSHPMVVTFGGEGMRDALTAEGHDASEDGTGRGSPLVAYALTSRNDRNDREENYIVAPSTAAPLTRGSATGDGVNPPGRRQEDDVNLIAMAFNPQTGGSRGRLGSIPKPTALSCTQATAVAFAENQRGELVESAISHQLSAGGGKAGQGYAAVRTDGGVRRLTPKERERLQGFPDDWTRWGLKDGRLVEQSDAARDRQTGNAVAVPVVEWIARRLVAADSAMAPSLAAACPPTARTEGAA